jgi:hypothetical protein
MLAAEVAEANRGWGGPAAILIALAAFYAITQYREWWQARKIQIPSPTPPRGGGHDEDPQVADGVTDDDTTDDTEPWWAGWQERIPLADGSTLVRQAKAVWRTGSAELPEDDEPDEPAAEPDDDEDQDGDDEVRGETRAEYADRLIAVPVQYTAAVQAIMRAYGVSESTAKRDIAAAQERAA